MKDTTFYSRYDLWLLLLVFAGVALPIVLGLYLRADEPIRSYIPIAIGVFLLLAVPFAMFPCRYTLDERHLHIRCGAFKQQIPYAEITGIELSGSMLSAPAWSLRRIRISFGSRSQLISPRNREGFMTELRARMSAADTRHGVSQQGRTRARVGAQ